MNQMVEKLKQCSPEAPQKLQEAYQDTSRLANRRCSRSS